VVIEINSSPGLEGIEAATGIDVAKKIIDFVAENALLGASYDRYQY
jgi:ribosomal protein S6--L-glutamate ligase